MEQIQELCPTELQEQEWERIQDDNSIARLENWGKKKQGAWD